MISNIRKCNNIRKINSLYNITIRNLYSEEEKKKYLTVKPYVLPNHEKIKSPPSNK